MSGKGGGGRLKPGDNCNYFFLTLNFLMFPTRRTSMAFINPWPTRESSRN